MTTLDLREQNQATNQFIKWNTSNGSVQADTLVECQDMIRQMALFMADRDRTYQQVANKMGQEIHGLNGRTRQLESELEVAQAMQKALQADLGQQKEVNKRLYKDLQALTQEHASVKGQVSTVERDHANLQLVVSTKARELNRQIEINTSQTLLKEQYRRKTELQTQLATTREKIATESNKIGGVTATGAGLVGFFVGGPIGGFLGATLGLITGNAAQSINCPCMTELSAQEQSLLTQLRGVDAEIQRLNRS